MKLSNIKFTNTNCMKQNNIHKIKCVALIVSLVVIGNTVQAQTDLDGIMMNKNQFCNGLMYSYNSWDHYWEGKLNRTNENLGTVSTQSVMYGANYGITGRLNVMISAPYVSTKSSAGTLHSSR